MFIPKPDGRLRPLGVAALEDKIVQRAVVEVLNAVYEEDFLGFSYGFRPGRSPHDALDALFVGITRGKVNWVLDADIRDYFTSLDQSWLVKFLEHRIADKRVIRLIQKWLRAGVIEDGEWSETVEGTPQGASVSTLLANVYLHYVFDLWVHQWRRRHARGDVVVVRFADDLVVSFQYRDDAERFWADLRERFAQFGLELNDDKTRLIEFGRFAAQTREAQRAWEAGDVRVPGLHAHLCEGQAGRFKLKRVTSKKRMRAKLHEVKAELRRRMHHPIPEQGAWLGQRSARTPRLLRSPGQQRSAPRLRERRHPALAPDAQAAQPATPNDPGEIHRLADRWLPRPRILHPWPTTASTPKPKAGARCVKRARRDLCGGPPATAVPTATLRSWGTSCRATPRDTVQARPRARRWHEPGELAVRAQCCAWAPAPARRDL